MIPCFSSFLKKYVWRGPIIWSELAVTVSAFVDLPFASASGSQKIQQDFPVSHWKVSAKQR